MVINVMDSRENVLERPDPFISNAAEVVRIKFVTNLRSSNSDIAEFAPEFCHQHFENEEIYGYKDLKVTLHYSESSMFIYPKISYSASTSGPDLPPDDIVSLLRKQLPEEQQSMMVGTPAMFHILTEKKQFQPFGELMTKFEIGSKKFELYCVTESSELFDEYLARVQSLALWYIDAADYTDNSDPRWMHYFLYESIVDENGGKRLPLAGYTSIIRMYAHPFAERARVAQIMVLPQYRKSGIGAKFYDAVRLNLSAFSKIVEITAEDPADSFIFMRDYVNCLNCLELPEFAPSKLKTGFTEEMRTAARDKFKIPVFQSRRVYEILRYRRTNRANPVELKEYRLSVKARLFLPMKKSDRYWIKVDKLLSEEDKIAIQASQQMDKRISELNASYEHTIADYEEVLRRIEKYPKI